MVDFADGSAPAAAGSGNDPIGLLRSLASSSSLPTPESCLSSDGSTLTLSSVSFDAKTRHDLTLPGGKVASYPLASLYLQIVNPDQTLVQYRSACKDAGVEIVKVTDKASILSYFAAAAAATTDDAAKKAEDDDMDIDDEEEDDDDDDRRRRRKEKERLRRKEKDRRSSREKDDRRSSKDRSRDKSDRHRSGRDRDRDRSSSRHKHHSNRSPEKERRSDRDLDDGAVAEGGVDGEKKRKKPAKAPMTNAQLLENLDTVVGKRVSVPGDAASGKDGEGDEAGAASAVAEGGGVEGEEGGSGVEGRDDIPRANEGSALAKGGAPDDEVGTPSSVPVSPPKPTIPSAAAAAAAAARRTAERYEEEDRALLRSCLSAAGFGVSDRDPALIETDRLTTDKIMGLEIPVGDSASVLRAGAGGAAGRDFARVLEMYAEVVKEEERAKRGATSGDKRGGGVGGGGGAAAPSKRARITGGMGARGAGEPNRPRPEGNPIIVVPNAMTSPVTMVNAVDFFDKSTFVPRDVKLKLGGRKQNVVTVTRRVAPRLGGGEVTYDIMDNPATRLKPPEWSRVVAVVAQGAAWQFKGWRYSNPVDIFSRTYGFYVGMEGAPVPNELRGWNVKLGRLNRDKRGLDSVTYASFWNGLDEWMAIHKPEFIPRDES